METEIFNKYYKDSKVRVEWDHSIFGTIASQEEQNYIVISTNNGLKSFPLEQLEWTD